MVMLCLNESTDPETTSMKSKDGKHYTKEDLMWEAVRRNENYRRYYRSARAWRRKSGVEEGTLPNHGFDHFPLHPQYKMYKVFDPKTDIQTIKGLIENGSWPEDVHPYYHFTRREKEHPIRHHTLPDYPYARSNKRDRREYGFERFDDNRDYFTIRKSAVANRVVISFDPLLSEKEVVAEVKKLRGRLLREYKETWEKRIQKDIADNAKRKTKCKRTISKSLTCYPRDIPSYLEWLKTYDDVLSNARKQRCRIKVIAGVKEVVDDRFDIMVIVPAEGSEKQLHNKKRIMSDNYTKAIQLIRIAPDIPFSPSRTRR